jgi:glucosamine 6-phosphate synthetase-like amidotransferase/phosphosugar isomerase protein
MCGIIYAHNRNGQDVNSEVTDQLEDQINRGQQGFGIVFADKNLKIKTLTRATELTKTLFDLSTNPAPCVLLHHRTPTSSRNKIKQTHPFDVNHGSLKHRYLVVVNGHVYNEKEMKKKHEGELGFVYNTDDKVNKEFNDCEALAWELARLIEGQTKTMEVKGNFAFIALQVDKDKITNVFFGTNASSCPLNLAMNEREVFISSEGKGDPIKEDVLYALNTETNKLKKKDFKVATTTYVTGYQYNDDDDDFTSYNRDVQQWRNDLRGKQAITTITEGDTTLNGELEENKQRAVDSLEEFFTFIDANDSKEVVMKSLKDSLEGIATEMMDAYYGTLESESEVIIDNILEDKGREMDMSGISFLPDKLFSK